MRLLVVGSLRGVKSHAEIAAPFVARLGELIVESGHTLLTGCRGSLDHAIAEAAHNRLQALNKDTASQIVGYRLQLADPVDPVDPVYKFGKILVSERTDWDLAHPDLIPPEQIGTADAAVFIAGDDGTYIAANWARIAGIPVLGIVIFGGAGQSLYESESKIIREKYGGSISREDFEVLTQDTTDVDYLAQHVLELAERIVTPRTVFPITSFSTAYRDVCESYAKVCWEFGLTLQGTEQAETTERITPRIIEGIRRSAFVIADVSEATPNVYYEIGYAHGLDKQVIVTAKKGTVLPFDVNDVPVLFWESHEGLEEKLRKRLGGIVHNLRGSRLGRFPQYR